MGMKLTRRKTPRINPLLSSMLHKFLSPMILIPLRDRFGGERDIEIDLLSKVVKRGDRVIDVGAHLGAYTFVLAKLVGKKGMVWAFEPSPMCFLYLKNGFRFRKQVKLHNLALSSKNQDLTLHSPDSSHGNPIASAGGSISQKFLDGRKEMVAGQTLDTFNLQDLSFIKIDTEGHELDVLVGSLQTIRASKPILLIEIFRGISIDKSNEIWNLLNEFKYVAYCVGNGQIRSLEVNQHLGDVKFRGNDRSVNFFFIPENRTGKILN